ncbi:MAG: hypothetical protein WC742_14590 [Gallionellaceae bacterium]|jgi:hypothetical protein
MPPPQPPSRVPEARPAGLIAIVLSSIITFKTAFWVSRVVEDFARSQGIESGFSLLEIGAIMGEWILLAQLIQFVMDEYFIIPIYHRLSASQGETFKRRVNGTETWWERYGFKIAFLVLLFFYFTKK